MFEENLQIECNMSTEKKGRKTIAVAKGTRKMAALVARAHSPAGCSVAVGLMYYKLPIEI